MKKFWILENWKGLRMRIAMAQINPTLGDLEGNTEKIREYINLAKKNKVDLIVFPELAITGYPPQDLLFENAFVKRNKELLEEIIISEGDIAGLTYPHRSSSGVLHFYREK